MGVAAIHAPERLTRSTWLALIAMGLGVFVIANDFTALSVAIPKIERDLHTSLSHVLGVGVGLFYSSVTTAAVTALDPARSSLAGGIVYMCQIAGGAIGLGLNTAIVLSAATLTAGISVAFRVDAALAVAGFAVSAIFVRGPRRSPAHRATAATHHRVRALTRPGGYAPDRVPALGRRSGVEQFSHSRTVTRHSSVSNG